MILYPAIDILGGKAVRLTKGDFDAKKVYDEDPLSAARGWVSAGADYLHVVDLDGARAGRPSNLAQLSRIVDELGVPVQFGGGLRTAQAVTDALEAGAQRIILGTAAFTDPALLDAALAEHGAQRILVAVDVRNGLVTTAGWTQTTHLEAEQVVAELYRRGVRTLVYTNVDRDGMLQGPDLDEVARIADAVRGSLIYSGGVGALGDLQALASLAKPNLDGVIVGKALYERRFTVPEARAVLGSATADS